MNTKAKGARNEHRSMELMERAGYFCIRSAASRSPWDFVGIGATDFVLGQSRTDRWPSREEMEDLKDFRCPPNTRKLIHVWRPRKRLPEVKEL